jgi:hypothetical protein
MFNLNMYFFLVEKVPNLPAGRQENKAFAALPKTGLHLVFGRLHIEGGFIPAGFLTANRLMPDVLNPFL